MRSPALCQVFAWSVLMTSALSVGASPAHAADAPVYVAPPPSKAQLTAGKKFFERGQQLYQEGKYEAAWIEFSSAYEIAALPDLVFNLARCEVKMGRWKEAAAHYREFLAAKPGDPETAHLEAEIKRLDRRAQGLPDEETPSATAPLPTPAAERKIPLAGALLGGGAVLFAVAGGISLGIGAGRYNDAVALREMGTDCGPCTEEQKSAIRTPLNAGYAMFGLAAVSAIAAAIVVPFELGLFNRGKSVSLLRRPPRAAFSFTY